MGGYFVEYKYAEQYGYKPGDFCHINSTDSNSIFFVNTKAPSVSPRLLVYWYHFIPEEYMCPANYSYNIDTQSWGLCSCWENGGRRSKNGQIASCKPILPANSGQDGDICTNDILCKKEYNLEEEEPPLLCKDSRSLKSIDIWCQQEQMSSLGQVCPTSYTKQDPNNKDIFCADESGAELTTVSAKVPHHQAISESQQ